MTTCFNAVLVEGNTVTNIIYIDEENVQAFNEAGMHIVPVSPLGLRVGDTTDGTDFYRDGQKLPIAETEEEPTGLTEQDYIDALNELGVNVT